MQDDLARSFPYVASIQPKKIRCLAMEKIGVVDPSQATKASIFKDSIGYTIQSFTTEQLVNLLQANNRTISTPIINRSEYFAKVDISFLGTLDNIFLVNKALLTKGLTLIEKELEIDMLVIRDK